MKKIQSVTDSLQIKDYYNFKQEAVKLDTNEDNESEIKEPPTEITKQPPQVIVEEMDTIQTEESPFKFE